MPLITVIILSKGNEYQLRKCVESVKLSSEWQLLVAVNGAELSAETQKFIHELKSDAHILHIPEKLSPGEVRSRALELSEGDWIHFLDEEVTWGKEYENVLAPLLEPGVEVLGGPLLPRKGIGAVSHALALSLSSPFCSGAYFARFRGVGRQLQETGFQKLSGRNLWLRKKLLKDHALPTDYEVSDTDILLQRLQAHHHHLYYHPRLSVGFSPSAHFLRLRRNVLAKGFESSQFLREKMTLEGSLHAVPALFVICHGFWPLYPEFFWQFFRLYYLVLAFVSIGLSFRARRPWLFPMVFFFHYFILWEYGWGFLYERLSHKWKTWNR